MMRTKHAGFTIIELSLSMTFVGILLIVTATTIIQLTNMYSKGMTYKLINQTGRDLGASLTRDAENAGSIDTPLIQPDATNGWMGRLCLGSYSYLWGDSGKLRAGSSDAPKYLSPSTANIILARVSDSGGTYCTKDASTGKYPTAVSQDTATEMLPNDKGDYALQAMSLKKVGTTNQNMLYAISYTIGTNENGTITGIGDATSCELASAAANNFNFCAVNTFDIMVKAGY